MLLTTFRIHTSATIFIKYIQIYICVIVFKFKACFDLEEDAKNKVMVFII